MIQPTIFSIATHPDHLLHPFCEDEGLTEASTLQKVIGIALFIFTGLITFGLAAIFYCVMAARKIKEVEPTEEETFLAMIEKVKSVEGKTGLFIKDLGTQSKPDDADHTWFVLGVQDDNHFKMRVNDQEKMALLQGLFDRVILVDDLLKSYERPWEQLKTLLKSRDPSVLITATGGVGASAHVTLDEDEVLASMQANAPSGKLTLPLELCTQEGLNRKAAFAEWQLAQGEEEAERQYQEWKGNLTEERKNDISVHPPLLEKKYRHLFMVEVIERENLAYDQPYKRCDDLFKDQIQDYLGTLFKNVELKKFSFPWSWKGTEYFEMTGPIN